MLFLSLHIGGSEGMAPLFLEVCKTLFSVCWSVNMMTMVDFTLKIKALLNSSETSDATHLATQLWELHMSPDEDSVWFSEFAVKRS
jgi:hypothetical protein